MFDHAACLNKRYTFLNSVGIKFMIINRIYKSLNG